MKIYYAQCLEDRSYSYNDAGPFLTKKELYTEIYENLEEPISLDCCSSLEDFLVRVDQWDHEDCDGFLFWNVMEINIPENWFKVE